MNSATKALVIFADKTAKMRIRVNAKKRLAALTFAMYFQYALQPWKQIWSAVSVIHFINKILSMPALKAPKQPASADCCLSFVIDDW